MNLTVDTFAQQPPILSWITDHETCDSWWPVRLPMCFESTPRTLRTQEPDLIKRIFLFFIAQLKGLQDPKDATFKRYFYLLENLAWVKSFNICIELEESQYIFCQLFSLIFKVSII